jgi:glycine/D-amino acid oxidase-like deaminating enzyme
MTDSSIFAPDVRQEPCWWEAARPVPTEPVALPRSVDVLVIGAGFTGASAALELARAGRSVLVAEAGVPGQGASTRNGGMVGSGHRVSYFGLRKRYGPDAALALIKEGQNALEFAAALIAGEGIDCHLRRSGRFRAAWRVGHYDAMGRELDAVRKLTGLEADMVPRAEQHRQVATDAYHGGVLYHTHGALHPALFHAGLLARARAAGAVVIGDTPVLGIDDEGDRVMVRTAGGTVAARDVVVATNAYTGAETPHLRRRVLIVGSYIIATEAIGEDAVAALIPSGRMIVETRLLHCYYRASPDGTRILFGGRAALRMVDERRSGRILHRVMTRLFPTLEGVQITHTWSGRVGFTRGQLPRVSSRGRVHHALGYCGSGVAMAPYLGFKAARRVLGADDARCAFDSLPFPAIPFYEGRPWFLPLLDAGFGLADRLGR